MAASLKTAAVDLKAAAARRLRRGRPPVATWKSRILAVALLATAITAVLTGVVPLSPTISFLFPPSTFPTSSSAYANSSVSLLYVTPPPPPLIRHPIPKRAASRASPIRNRGSAGVNSGGDCIAIGSRSSDVNIIGIASGPGRGISIGSSAGNSSSLIVEDVNVSNGSFYQSDGGLRVQTWQGRTGHAEGILFKHINFTSVGSPIVIDPFYCPGAHCKNSTSTVEVTDARFVDVHGTSTTDMAIKFACNEKVPCTGIILDNVGITSVARQNQATSYCLNAKGKKLHEVIPDIACLA